MLTTPTCCFAILLITSIVLEGALSFSVISHSNLNQVPRTNTDPILGRSLSNVHNLKSTTRLYSDYLSSLSTQTPTPSKKTTPKNTTQNRLTNKTLPNGTPNYCAILNEKLNTLSTSNEKSTTTFSPASMVYDRTGPESAAVWKCAFVGIEGSLDLSSDWMTSKKKAKQDASRRYLDFLTKVDSQSKPSPSNAPKKAFEKYGISTFSNTIDPSTTPAVEELIQTRDTARSALDYNTADALRVQLWKTHRVAVDDISKTYSVGGDFGPKGTFRWTDEGPINPRKVKTATATTTVEAAVEVVEELSDELDLDLDLDSITEAVEKLKEAKGTMEGVEDMFKDFMEPLVEAKQKESKPKAEGKKKTKDAKKETKSRALDAKKVTKPKAEAKKVTKPKAEAKKVTKPKAEAKKVTKPKAEAKDVTKSKAPKATATKAPKAAATKETKPKTEAEKLAKSIEKDAKKKPKPKTQAKKETKPKTEKVQATTAKGNDDDIDEAQAKRQLEARNQPKPPDVEAQLQAKYAAIEDLGEKAHAICYDLGIV